jgi:branched-subunit amino acid ABC-type transport system permease component
VPRSETELELGKGTVLAAIGEDLLRAVLQGMPPGTVYALVAIGFVLAYKTSGIFNLAFGAQAYVSAVVYFKLHTEWEWPIVPSVVISVVLLAPLVGIVLEWAVFRHLRTAPAIAGLVVSIGLTLALPAIIDILMSYEPKTGLTPEGIVPNGNSVFYEVFGVYSFSRNELVAMAAALLATAALAALFTFTTVGLRMRAVVESPRMTELNGINADRVSTGAWALSSLFAGLAGVLIAPRFTTLAAPEFFNIVVVSIAAAAVGYLVSLPRAFAGGLGLGILIALFNTFIPKWSNDLTWLRPIQNNLTPAIPFIVLFGVLVFVPSVRRSHRAADPLSGVDPPPTSEAHAVESRPLMTTRRVVELLAVAAGLTVLFTRGDSVWIFLATQGVVLAVVFLSITVMTGFAGHISLCQGAFAAIGAFTVYQLATRYDTPVLVGALIGAVIAAAVGALLSLPLMRLNDIWIAIATLAFAYFFTSVMVKFSWVGGSPTQAGSALKVPRPQLGPWDFENDKVFLALALVILLIVTLAVSLFGHSTTGRTLRAVRGSEAAAQSIGISIARTRVITFAVSAFVAAIGGAMIAIHQENVSYDTNFSPFGSLFWLVIVVTFGVRRPSGALWAAGMFSLFDRIVLQGSFAGWILRDPERIPGIFPISPKWRYILFGLGTIQYAKHPEGVIELARERGLERRAKRAARRAARSGGGPSSTPPAEPAGVEEVVQ